jgi:hypothetical protein
MADRGRGSRSQWRGDDGVESRLRATSRRLVTLRERIESMRGIVVRLSPRTYEEPALR